MSSSSSAAGAALVAGGAALVVLARGFSRAGPAVVDEGDDSDDEAERELCSPVPVREQSSTASRGSLQSQRSFILKPDRQRSGASSSAAPQPAPGASTWRTARTLLKVTSSFGSLLEEDDSLRDSTSVVYRSLWAVSQSDLLGSFVDHSGQLITEESAERLEVSKPAELAFLSWNVNGRELVAADARAWVSAVGKADLYFVGFQELHALNTLHSLQHLTGMRAPWSRTRSKEEHASEVLRQALQEVHGERYEPLDPAGLSMVGLFLLAFRRADFAAPVKGLQLEAIPAGFAGVCGNKGGVAVRMSVGGASLCVVNCHLPAGKGSEAHAAERRRALRAVLDGLAECFGAKEHPPPAAHDLCVVLGDLNARLMGLSRDEVAAACAAAEADGAAATYGARVRARLAESDELGVGGADLAELGFSEGAVAFAPTYKYDVGTDDFDSSAKLRPPAWTDRVLWAGRRADAASGQLIVSEYTAVPRLVASDHKPVAARLTWQLAA